MSFYPPVFFQQLKMIVLMMCLLLELTTLIVLLVTNLDRDLFSFSNMKKCYHQNLCSSSVNFIDGSFLLSNKSTKKSLELSLCIFPYFFRWLAVIMDHDNANLADPKCHLYGMIAYTSR